MRFPLVVIAKDSGDVSLFEELKGAESAIEPPDIKVSEAFDANGMILRAEAVEPQGKFVSSGGVRLIATDQYDADKLRARLLKYLSVLKVKVENRNADLDVLLSLLAEKIGYG